MLMICSCAEVTVKAHSIAPHRLLTCQFQYRLELWAKVTDVQEAAITWAAEKANWQLLRFSLGYLDAPGVNLFVNSGKAGENP